MSKREVVYKHRRTHDLYKVLDDEAQLKVRFWVFWTRWVPAVVYAPYEKWRSGGLVRLYVRQKENFESHFWVMIINEFR